MRSWTTGRLTRGLRRLRLLPQRGRPRREHSEPPVVRSRRGPRIAVVGTDPYLPYLLRIRYPDAEISEHPDLDSLEHHSTPPDAVVAEVGGSPPQDLEGLTGSAPMIAIARSGSVDPAQLEGSVEEVLLRPFAAHELHAAVERVLGIPAGPAAPSQRPSRIPGLLTSSLGPLRLAAVGVSGVVLLVDPAAGARQAAVFGGLFAYLLLRFLLRRETSRWALADTAVVAAALAVDGGLDSPHPVLALVVALEAGLLLNVPRGLTAALVLALAGAAGVLVQGDSLAVTSQQFLSASALPLLLAVIGGMTGRIWGAQGSRDLEMLRETNRILSTLYRITRTIPGGLETGNVVAAALEEMRLSLDVAAGAVFLEEAGLLSCMGAFGAEGLDGLVLGTEDPRVRSLLDAEARELSGEQVPDPLAPALDAARRWWVLPLVNDGVSLGLLLASPGSGAEQREQRLYLEELAAEVSVALSNARLFTRVGEFSADQERQRLAREIHDGVGQSLTHLRREVEYLHRHGQAADLAAEADRLLRVIDRAGADVRRTIEGLRSVAAAGGLAAALRDYVRDLRALRGPEVVLDIRGTARFDPEVESEVFRIAQEATANAFRHARADRLEVTLVIGDGGLVLTVTDDGVGLTAGQEGEPDHLGLRAMRERADLIGATLTLTAPPEGGTRVRLEYRGTEPHR